MFHLNQGVRTPSRTREVKFTCLSVFSRRVLLVWPLERFERGPACSWSIDLQEPFIPGNRYNTNTHGSDDTHPTRDLLVCTTLFEIASAFHPARGPLKWNTNQLLASGSAVFLQRYTYFLMCRKASPVVSGCNNNNFLHWWRCYTSK